MTLHLGIDEAGRGPVIGPMVFGAVRCTDAELNELIDGEFSDSKSLSASTRENRRLDLEQRNVELYVEVIPARKINSTSLTELSLSATSRLINRAQPDRVLLDAPGHPSAIDEYLNRLTNRLELKNKPDVLAEPGADDTYPIVSAASIIAKTTRDRRIEQLQERFGDLGSGYPSDPTTRAFLKNHLSEQEPVRKHIRTRWQTFQDLLAEEGGSLYRDQPVDPDDSSS